MVEEPVVFQIECPFCERVLGPNDEVANLTIPSPNGTYQTFESHLGCLLSALRSRGREIIDDRIRQLKRMSERA
jgi:hypothetical protein